MSYEIIYQYRVFKTDTQAAGDGQPRYVVAVEMGSNNCYVHGNKRARDWGVLAVGNETEVMRQVVRIGSSCEGGMLKPGGRDCKPEQLMGKIRRMLGRAQADDGMGGWWRPLARVGDSQEADFAKSLGATIQESTLYGRPRVQADFDACLPGYFQFVTKVHRHAYGWSMAEVYGLRPS